MMHFKCDLLLFTNPYSQGYQSHLIVIHAHIHFFSISYASHMLLYLTLKGDLSTLSHNFNTKCSLLGVTADMTLLNVISHPSSSHWPKLLAREWDATKFNSKGFQCEQLFAPCVPKKRKFFEFSIKHYIFGSEADPTRRVVSRAAERSGECASKKKSRTRRVHAK